MSTEAIQGESPSPTRRPWGPGATIGWSVVIMIAFFLAQSISAMLLLILRLGVEGLASMDAKSLESDGMVISVATLGSFFLCVPLILFLAWLRKGPSVREYLGLRSPLRGAALIWTVAFIALIVGIEILNVILNKPAVPDFMKAAYASVPHPVWLFLAVAIAAPVFEELFFRGFALEGLRHSRLGEIGAILSTSAAWAIIHLQYGIYEITIIFVMGIVLGLARLRTNSLWTPIALHALNNTVAMIQVAMLAADSAG